MITIDESKHTFDEVKDHVAQKIKMYPIIVRELIDAVHSAYLRAYRGGERESLRTARTVTQSEPLYGNNPNSQGIGQNKFKLYNPSTWK